MLEFEKITRKFDLAHYKGYLSDFVPIACHYNKDTLLSKNGELIQIIKIKGINKDNISENIRSIRSALRGAIDTHVSDNNFSFWIHTIRKREDLTDTREYKNIFAAKLNDEWIRKNFWDDKFVNELYISIVHFGIKIRSNGIKTFLQSLSSKFINNKETKFLQNSFQKLDGLTKNLIECLAEYFPLKLGLVEKNGTYFSDLMKLYRYIIQMEEEECIAPIVDISKNLTTECKYIVGNDYLKITRDNNEKFASIISLKEYVDVPQIVLADFLIYPIEFVVTEIICFVNKKLVQSHFKDQDHILTVSKSNRLREIKNFDYMLGKENDQKFCIQQISIMLMSDDIDVLNDNIISASKRLSRVGIVNVQEDINLEKIFWSQLPSNFNFIFRAFPSTIESSCAFSTLHSFPVGRIESKWGKAITLLRTARGTPYFMNLHDKDRNATNVIFGNKKR